MSGEHRPIDDFYETPEHMTQVLLKHVEIPNNVYLWESSCGLGAISRFLPAERTLNTDLIDRGFGISGIDFLKVEKSPFNESPFWIITNPPYNIADDYIRKGLQLGAEKIIVLLRFAYCCGARKSDLIDNHLEKVLLFTERTPMYPYYMPKLSTFNQSKENHAWFIFGDKKNCRLKENCCFEVERISKYEVLPKKGKK